MIPDWRRDSLRRRVNSLDRYQILSLVALGSADVWRSSRVRPDNVPADVEVQLARDFVEQRHRGDNGVYVRPRLCVLYDVIQTMRSARVIL